MIRIVGDRNSRKNPKMCRNMRKLLYPNKQNGKMPEITSWMFKQGKMMHAKPCFVSKLSLPQKLFNKASNLSEKAQKW